ncbi:MAG TPA: hypothetical protein VJ508_02995 [Saprospiraceae bacterium]|nr:hypothetical protein [Saprospiraceae bacterium]
MPVANYIREDFPTGMIDRMPQPARAILVATVTPHVIECSRFNFVKINKNIVRIQAFQRCSVDRFEASFLFLIR